MDFWAETMQDDCYLIAADGWVAETHRVLEEVTTGKKKGEMKDKGWTCDLIPKPYIVARYFAKEQAALDALQAELDAVSTQLAELAEEHGGEEGPLKDVSSNADAREAYTQALVAAWHEDDKIACSKYSALVCEAEEHAALLRTLTDHHYISVLKDSKGKLPLKVVKDRLAATGDKAERATLNKYLEADKQQKAKTKEAAELLAEVEATYHERLRAEPLPEELADLQVTVRYLELLDEQSDLRAKVKEADAVLDKLAHDKYPTLTVKEIKILVVDDKWLPALAASVQSELDRVSQTLTGRIRQLADRYETPLHQLTARVADLSACVDEHLKKMGAVWK